MSHFVEMQVEFETKHEDVLVRVLKEAFGATKVEVSEKGMDLKGYYAAREAPPCHIVVHERYDVGFFRQPEGKYKVFHDSDDRATTTKLKTVVKQNYVVRVAEKAMVLSGYHPVDRDAEGWDHPTSGVRLRRPCR
jgi:hypothetical protein